VFLANWDEGGLVLPQLHFFITRYLYGTADDDPVFRAVAVGVFLPRDEDSGVMTGAAAA